MKVTVLNKDKNTYRGKNKSMISSIILLVLGIFLTFNSEGLLNIIFGILGGLVIVYGIYRFAGYYKLKTQFQTEDSNALISAIVSISIGLLIILLANVLTNTIQIVTGIWLLFMGISKLSSAMVFKNVDQRSFISLLISAILLIILGIYTIFTDNVVFIFIGIILIVYAVADLINYFIRIK